MASDIAWRLSAASKPEWNLRVVRPESPVVVAESPLAGLAEDELVAACLSGRPGAFDLLVERHRRPI